MIFQKIARLLKSEINGNSWHVGDLLPSEAELAVRYNVSRNTLRKALSLLEGEGIIHRKHGSGTYIQKKNFVAHIDHMNSFSEIAHKSGKEAGSQIMKFEVQDASPTIATELNLVTGEQVYYIKRLRFIEDNAAQLEETWMSVALAPLKLSPLLFLPQKSPVFYGSAHGIPYLKFRPRLWTVTLFRWIIRYFTAIFSSSR